jgi:hypothetical protein
MIEIDEEKNPLWRPGTYPHDSGDGTWHKEFWAIRVVQYDERWLTGLRTYANWGDRIRFASKTEARKWYWDTVLTYTPSFTEKEAAYKRGTSLPVTKVTLVHVRPKRPRTVESKTDLGQQSPNIKFRSKRDVISVETFVAMGLPLPPNRPKGPAVIECDGRHYYWKEVPSDE